MRKTIIAATLAMTVGVAGAQAGGGYVDNTQYVAPAATTTAAPISGTVVLTDVPAGHWAREAVSAVVEAGLIQGFPDGTFRGNENLTRYQAAMIFHRLLQSGALSGSDISDEDLLVITRGMQEVSTELAAISSRLTDVERLTVEQQARIDALEAAIANVGGADTTALEGRIAALEARIAALEAAPAPVVVTPAPVETTPAPVTETPVTGDPIVIDTPDVVVPAVGGNMYAGIGGGYYPNNQAFGRGPSYPANPKSDERCLQPFTSLKNTVTDATTGTTQETSRVDWCGSVFGTVGMDNIYGPVGGRVNVEYIPGREAIAADANAVANFDLGLVQPYLGAGVGVANGVSLKDRAERATDIYGNVLGGVDFKVTPNVGVFAEGNGKYYFSGNTLLSETSAGGKGLGFGARAGLKLFF